MNYIFIYDSKKIWFILMICCIESQWQEYILLKSIYNNKETVNLIDINGIGKKWPEEKDTYSSKKLDTCCFKKH